MIFAYGIPATTVFCSELKEKMSSTSVMAIIVNYSETNMRIIAGTSLYKVRSKYFTIKSDCQRIVRVQRRLYNIIFVCVLLCPLGKIYLTSSPNPRFGGLNLIYLNRIASFFSCFFTCVDDSPLPCNSFVIPISLLPFSGSLVFVQQ